MVVCVIQVAQVVYAFVNKALQVNFVIQWLSLLIHVTQIRKKLLSFLFFPPRKIHPLIYVLDVVTADHAIKAARVLFVSVVQAILAYFVIHFHNQPIHAFQIRMFELISENKFYSYFYRCRNGGTCHPTGSGFMCLCCAGFTGQFCDSMAQPPNPCHPNPYDL